MGDAGEDQLEHGVPPFLREYLYVDVDRVRSLLAQLDGGAPSTSVEGESTGSERGGSVGVSSIGLSARRSRADKFETTRTLGDLIVPLFEEAAEATGFLRDLTEDARQADSWRDGSLHDGLEPGQLIRVTAVSRIVDPDFVVSSLDAASSAMAAVQPKSKPTKGGGGRTTPPKASGQSGTTAAEAHKISGEIGALVKSILRAGVSFRAYPCGLAEPDCAFGAVLLDRSEYIEPERAALFAKFGVAASDWTLLAAVARLPSPTVSALPVLPTGSLVDGPTLRRDTFEEFLTGVLGFFESSGMIEGPRWPSIAVTPLAVYRTFPPHRDLPSSDG